MTTSTSRSAAGPRDDSLAESIAQLSLAQALQDVEVANSRVIDLTERLTGVLAELHALRVRVGELEHRGVAGLYRGSGTITSRAIVVTKAVARAVLPLKTRVWLRSQLR